MANMSYCRFQNTLQDLRDCKHNLHEDLSKDEHDARKRLIELCRDIVEEAERNDVEDMPFDEEKEDEEE